MPRPRVDLTTCLAKSLSIALMWVFIVLLTFFRCVSCVVRSPVRVFADHVEAQLFDWTIEDVFFFLPHFICLTLDHAPRIPILLRLILLL